MSTVSTDPGRGTTPRLLPVFLEAAVVQCCVEPPALGRRASWHLVFLEQSDAPSGRHGLVRLDAVAHPSGPPFRDPVADGTAGERHPTRLVAGDAVLHWDAAWPAEGAERVNGYVHVAHDHDVPAGLQPTGVLVRDVQVEERRFTHVAGEPGDGLLLTGVPARYRGVPTSPASFGPLEVDDDGRFVETGVLVVVDVLGG